MPLWVSSFNYICVYLVCAFSVCLVRAKCVLSVWVLYYVCVCFPVCVCLVCVLSVFFSVGGIRYSKKSNQPSTRSIHILPVSVIKDKKTDEGIQQKKTLQAALCSMSGSNSTTLVNRLDLDLDFYGLVRFEFSVGLAIMVLVSVVIALTIYFIETCLSKLQHVPTLRICGVFSLLFIPLFRYALHTRIQTRARTHAHTHTHSTAHTLSTHSKHTL